MLSAIGISATGLESRRVWMNTIAENIANAETTRNSSGESVPYRRREPIFEANAMGSVVGVKVREIAEDSSEFQMRHLPGHPDANEDGYVAFPNVNPVQEMVDLIMASRSYEANVTAIETTKSMFAAASQIIA